MRVNTHLLRSAQLHADAPNKRDAACNFVENETTAVPVSPESLSESVTADSVTAPAWPEIDACLAYNEAECFRDRREWERQLYSVAYPAYLTLHRGDDAAFDYAVQQLPPDSRKRRPSRRHPEVLALTLATKPTKLFQRKMCSAYGAVLLVGHNNGLNTPEFIEWAVEADVEECRASAAVIRARRKPRVAPAVDTGDAPIWLTISCGIGRTVGAKYQTCLSPDVAQAIATLLKRAGDASLIETLSELNAVARGGTDDPCEDPPASGDACAQPRLNLAPAPADQASTSSEAPSTVDEDPRS